MKKILTVAALAIISVLIATPASAQKQPSKDDWFQQIAKLSNSKKPEDREKAYQQSKEYIAQYGKDNDDKAKKVRTFRDGYRLNEFNRSVDEQKVAEALRYGREILADEPENSYVTMNLAYSALDVYQKKQDKTYFSDGINYAQQTISLFEEGKLPKEFKPFKDQAEVTALMYFALGSFSVEGDLKGAAYYFQKAVSYESQVKSKSYPYYIVAFYYERRYESLAADFQKKHGSKPTEDAALKADREKIDAVIDAMIDAYARTVKLAEPENSPNLADWKARLTQIYQFRKGTDKGLTELINSVLNKPLEEVIQ